MGPPFCRLQACRPAAARPLSLQSAAGAAGATGSDHLGGQALPLRSDRRGHVRPAGASDLAPSPDRGAHRLRDPPVALAQTGCGYLAEHAATAARGDRKSTRLNSSHVRISYAVFCLKKKKKKETIQ